MILHSISSLIWVWCFFTNCGSNNPFPVARRCQIKTSGWILMVLRPDPFQRLAGLGLCKCVCISACRAASLSCFISGVRMQSFAVSPYPSFNAANAELKSNSPRMCHSLSSVCRNNTEFLTLPIILRWLLNILWSKCKIFINLLMWSGELLKAV